MRCGGCRFVFLDPIPGPNDLDRIYRQDAHFSTDQYPKARSRQRRAFLGAVRFIPYVWQRGVFEPRRHVRFFGEENLRRLFDAHGFEFKRCDRDRKTGLKVLFRKR